VILSLVALLGCSSAQERFDAPYGVLQRVKVSEATSERLLVRRIEPTYPRAAQQKCLQGNMVLSVIVAEDGYVKSRASDQRTCRIARRCRKSSNPVEI